MEKLQKTRDWYRSRIGKITGSECGKLFVSGKSKNEIFGKTAKSYLFKIAAERSINPRVLDNDALFDTYIEQISVSSRAMEWGTEMEDVARQQFSNTKLVSVEEVGSCVSEKIPTLAASPDGIYYEDGKKCVLEIKCPSIQVAFEYSQFVKDWDSLKAMNAEYYWQVVAEMFCTNSEVASFCVFNPFLSNSLHIVNLLKNEEAEQMLVERVHLAEKFISGLYG